MDDIANQTHPDWINSRGASRVEKQTSGAVSSSEASQPRVEMRPRLILNQRLQPFAESSGPNTPGLRPEHAEAKPMSNFTPAASEKDSVKVRADANLQRLYNVSVFKNMQRDWQKVHWPGE